jgi:hypothetical protein
MTSNERQQRMDAARVHAELTVHDLWLRYLALGGTGDAFDLDGYLQALVPLETFQQDVLAQALNEALEEGYRSYCVPLSAPPADDAGDDRLHRLIDALLDGEEAALQNRSEPAGTGPPDAGTAR